MVSWRTGHADAMPGAGAACTACAALLAAALAGVAGLASIAATGCNGAASPRAEPAPAAAPAPGSAANPGSAASPGSGEASNRGTPMTSSPDLSALTTSLQQDVQRDIPPFGANSVKLARQLGTAATGVLVRAVRARGSDAFLALEALRAADPAAYGTQPAADRAAIYAFALQHNAFFNSWGQPGMSLSDTARAFAALGDAAVAALAPLLADRRPAPSSGSQDATLSKMNGNRVCDYAWVLISEARGASYVYESAPADRDREIDAMRASLPRP
jgi:hypothetical protein